MNDEKFEISFDTLLKNAERFGVTYYPSADGKGHVLFEGHEMTDEELIDCLCNCLPPNNLNEDNE